MKTNAFGLFLFLFTIIGTIVVSPAAQAGLTMKNMGDRLIVSSPHRHGDLVVYPLLLKENDDHKSYMSLDEAVKAGVLKISEWGSGEVPKLKVVNKGNKEVFIMTGEIVTGAKQDRMAAHDVLLGRSQAPVALPVYCVEQSRWAMKSRNFSSGGTLGTKKVRRSAVKKFNQNKIWNDVAEKSQQSGVNSQTGTMQDVYADRTVQKRTGTYLAALKHVAKKEKNMIGVVMVSKNRIASVDVFANPVLMKKMWPKLLLAAVVDAITQEKKSQAGPSIEDVRRFMEIGLAGKRKKIDNPGLGREYLIEGREDVSGSVLVCNGAVIHLGLFTKEEGDRVGTLSNGQRIGNNQLIQRQMPLLNSPNNQMETPNINDQPIGQVQQ